MDRRESCHVGNMLSVFVTRMYRINRIAEAGTKREGGSQCLHYFYDSSQRHARVSTSSAL
jgi:hypothetical protein